MQLIYSRIFIAVFHCVFVVKDATVSWYEIYQLIFSFFFLVIDRIQLTVATVTDDGTVWLKKNFPR